MLQNHYKLLLLLWSLKYIHGERGSVLIKALCYKTEGRGFETQRGECSFLIYVIISAALGLGVYSASNRNEYQKQKK
jgi:hypothetical protein